MTTESERPSGRREYGIALIGTGFMGSLHARAYLAAPQIFRAAEARPAIRIVVDIREADAEEAARRWGAPRWSADWRSAITAPDVEVVDICTPPALHVPIAMAAAEAGKHVYCEKPVGRNLAETETIWRAVEAAGVASFVGFNYRWAPAVQYAREIVQSERLGPLRLIRVSFRTDYGADRDGPLVWRFSAAAAGFGALGDLGSHVFDLARHLAGDITELCGHTALSVASRSDPSAPGSGPTLQVDNDDSFAALVRFASGATGVLEGSRVATGSKSEFTFEIVGAEGALRWDLRRMNELLFYSSSTAPLDRGFTTIQTAPDHPSYRHFLPSAIGLGYADTKVIEVNAFLEGLAHGRPVGPTIEDALAVGRLLDAVPRRAWVTLLPPGPSPGQALG